MAYKLNSIGNQSFIFLRGEAGGVRNAVELIARQNVAALSSRIFAAKGVPFVLTSLASTTTEAAAQTKYQAYQTLLNTGLVTLVKDNVDFNLTHSVGHKVLSVELLDIMQAGVLVGNVTPGDQYLLTCQWTLVAVGV